MSNSSNNLNNKSKVKATSADLKKISRIAYSNINLSPVIVSKTISRSLRLKIETNESSNDGVDNATNDGLLKDTRKKLFTTNQLIVMARANRKFKSKKAMSMIEIKPPKKPFQTEQIVAKDKRSSIINSEQIILENYNLNARYLGYKGLYTMILRAWRKRKTNVDNLMKDLKRCNFNLVKIDSQLHVMTSLYKNEKQHYEETLCELKQSRGSIDKLKSEVNSVESEKLHLKFKYETELKNYVEMINSLKNDLKKATINMHTLEYNWENSKNVTKELMKRIDIFQEKITEMNMQKEKWFLEHSTTISKKDLEINNLKEDLDVLKKKYEQNKIRDSRIKEYQKLESIHMDQIQKLTNQLVIERQINTNSISHKISSYISHIPRRPLWYLQIFTSLVNTPTLPLSAIPRAKKNIIREEYPSTSTALVPA